MCAVAVVTGATGGIGAAAVRGLAGRGYAVRALGRSQRRLDLVCREVPDATPVVLDLAEPVHELPPALAAEPRIDVLVHCAGVAEVASVSDADTELWRRTFAVNVAGPAELTRLLLPALRAGRGRVVFLNMAPGLRAVPRWSAYVGSKAALRELADSLREEEEDVHGVSVTTIYPGATATPLLQQVRHDFGRAYDERSCLSPEAVADAIGSLLEVPAGVCLSEISIIPGP
jgi:NADP-dependent 3-hydroxy acid dehydrogenase YdfG